MDEHNEKMLAQQSIKFEKLLDRRLSGGEIRPQVQFDVQMSEEKLSILVSEQMSIMRDSMERSLQTKLSELENITNKTICAKHEEISARLVDFNIEFQDSLQ